MSDIFISYSSADRERARQIAEELVDHGWTVWWDREIAPGSKWDKAIEQALTAARCVLVLWSKNSAESDWVKTEAAEGLRRKVLVPAMIDPVMVPLEFRRLQAADLSHWDGDPDDAEYQKLLKAINEELREQVRASTVQPALTGAAGLLGAATAPPPADESWGPARRRRRIGWIALAAGVAGVAALVAVAYTVLAVRFVEVPDVRGKPYDEALVALVRVRLVPVLPPRFEIVPVEQVGTLMEQNPRAGIETPKGTNVELVVGGAPSVPTLVGQTLEQARELLREAHLLLGDERGEGSDQPAGTVIRQSTEPGRSLSMKSRVDVVIALPAGAYLGTCGNLRVRDSALLAECVDSANKTHSTLLERYANCAAGSIVNDGGQLSCRR